MSKYSTEELIRSIKAEGRQIQGWFNKDEADAIIAKLKAGEKLCEVAKGLVSSCTPELYDEYFEATKKAIAEYEGKE